MALIGAHLSIAGGLWKAIERGEKLGCEAAQIFTKNQLQWRTSPLSMNQCEQFYRCWQRSSIKKIIAHASYLINLSTEGAIWKKSVDSLLEEVKRCDLLGIDDIVLHPGSHKGDGIEKGLHRLKEGLSYVLEESDDLRVRILLETMSGQGNSVGSTLEELHWVMVSLEGTRRLGICLDTCHLFSAGYELRSREGYNRLVEKIDHLFGVQKVGCWHLNDSFFEKGSKRDHHAHLGEGKLGINAFSFILNDERWNGTPCLLETPKDGIGDEGNLAILRKLRGK